jgi:hypothetical protein
VAGGRGGSLEVGFRGGASPELGDLGAPGVKTTRAWVKKVQRDLGRPSRAKAGRGKDSGCAHDDRGGSARRCIAGARVPATRASFGLRHLAQDDQGNDVVLTEGLNGPERQRKMVGDEGRAARTGGAHGGRRCRGLHASGHRGSTRGDPAKILRG